MARRGRALAVAVATGIGPADAFARQPAARRPHLSVAGVDALLALYDHAGRPAAAISATRVTTERWRRTRAGLPLIEPAGSSSPGTRRMCIPLPGAWA